jgi:hypothetical protein
LHVYNKNVVCDKYFLLSFYLFDMDILCGDYSLFMIEILVKILNFEKHKNFQCVLSFHFILFDIKSHFILFDVGYLLGEQGTMFSSEDSIIYNNNIHNNN